MMEINLINLSGKFVFVILYQTCGLWNLIFDITIDKIGR